MTNIHSDKILILDFGAQYTQLIARRIRELGVYCEIWAWDHDPVEVAAWGAQGIILSGGPESTTQPNAPAAPQAVFDAGVPLLGICYGMQTMAKQLGGNTEAADQREFGHAQVSVVAEDRLLHGLSDHDGMMAHLDVWMSHGDHVSVVPSGFTVTAVTDRIPIAAFADDQRRWYGVQFHPEVTHTRQGGALLRRFVVDICGCEPCGPPATSSTTRSLAYASRSVRRRSSWDCPAAWIPRWLPHAGAQAPSAIAVDLRLRRHRPAAPGRKAIRSWRCSAITWASRSFARSMPKSAYFSCSARASTDPEAKRKTIGRVFVEVFDEESKKLANAKWLAQGTIYPDVIESAASKTGKAHVIKSHHNVGGLPEEMKTGPGRTAA
jgi:GMP synthase (glutamine-hydrolysing)